MTDYATLATELRWLSDDDGLVSEKMNKAADAIEILIRERDEARRERDEACIQIEYLHGKFQPTGSGEAVLTRLRALERKPE